MNLRRWFQDHSLKLLAIRDTPEAIAGGVAIGIFFGFTPLFGLKTLSAIFFAWLTRSNILAAVIAGALHDIILPFMPVIYRWEYDVGVFLLSHPHRWPESLAKLHREGFVWHSWTSLFGMGKPLLVGGCVCAAPFAVASFFITRTLVARHQLKKAAHSIPPDEEANPS
ncbi:MAG TPA: DUF2062 domain-containing protein [Candidatus Limnocylindrales bacterium]|nr:DUF2062 domain-containing protein [Candidatus Limnocylindrales bacterium]